MIQVFMDTLALNEEKNNGDSNLYVSFTWWSWTEVNWTDIGQAFMGISDAKK